MKIHLKHKKVRPTGDTRSTRSYRPKKESAKALPRLGLAGASQLLGRLSGHRVAQLGLLPGYRLLHERTRENHDDNEMEGKIEVCAAQERSGRCKGHEAHLHHAC